MRARCFISEGDDPFLNLAIEEWIFNDLPADSQTLFLWRNAPTVVVGRNQNPWAECDVDKLEAEGVHLVRRQSGGGAVFQDLGNLNFTFLSARKDYDRNRNFEIIVSALRKCGVNAEVSGRNDILVDGKKISGSAFKEKVDRAFHHGTLLVNVDLSRLAGFLTPSKKKLEAKGTTSVRARVVNLTEVNEGLNVEKLRDVIIDEFFTYYGSERKVEVLNHETLKQNPEISKYYDLLMSKEWKFGETPKFNQFFEERFEWGGVDVHLYFNEGKIERVKVFSDALETEMIDDLERSLIGVSYDRQEVLQKLGELAEKREYGNKILEFANWIAKEI